MTQIITVSCKLDTSSEMAKEIDATLERFAAACEWTNANTPPHLTNKTAMQSLVYQQVRQQFGLSANLAIQSIRRVCANRKTAKEKNRPIKGFKPTSATYDARIFSFCEKNWSVSVKLLHQRAKLELQIGNYQRHLLKEQNPKSATLVKRQSGEYYIDIQIEKPTPDPKPTDKVVGVDLGRTDIAVTSAGESWSGKEITEKRNHYAKMRAVLQKKASKGTRSSRRACRKLLKRLSGKEKRYQKHINHQISTHLVKNAAASEKFIALEDLTGIRERTNQQPRSKKERRLSNSWAFYQLRTFILYKALIAGVKVVLVPPAYTSQTCHRCLHIHLVKGKSYRHGKKFHCGHCGWKGDSDRNGSLMIAALGARYAESNSASTIAPLGLSVNQPGSPYLSCELKDFPYNSVYSIWWRATESRAHNL